MSAAGAPSPSIRLAEIGDAPAIAEMSARVLHVHVLPEQPAPARAQLLEYFSAEAIGQRIAAGHRHHLAVIEGRIAGAIGTRGDAHVHLLFVDLDFQRRGVARALWQAALAACVNAAQPAVITVNSSAYAVPVYRRLGFELASEVTRHDDILATPMTFIETDADRAAIPPR